MCCFDIFRFSLLNWFVPKFSSSLKSVWSTSFMAPLRTLRRICSPFCEMSWLILCSATLILSVVALISPGAIFPTWLTVSLPAYTKSYLLRNPPSSIFLLYRTIGLLFLFILFFLLVHVWISNFPVQPQWNQEACFFLITILSSNYLFNISIYKRCSPSNTSFNLSLLNLDVIKPFEFLGKKKQ